MHDIIHLGMVMKRGGRLARICSHSLAVVVRQVRYLESAGIQLPPLTFLQTSLDTESPTSSQQGRQRK
jgi:hypothetical protein